MDGDPFGTEARDDQGHMAAHARPAPLLCLDRRGPAARRRGVNAFGVSSRQSAGDGARRDDCRPTARVARCRGPAATIRPATSASLRPPGLCPATGAGLCPATGFPGLVSPLGAHRGDPRGGGATTRACPSTAIRLRGPWRHAGRSRLTSLQASTARGLGHSPGGKRLGSRGDKHGDFRRADGLVARPPADGVARGQGLPVRDHGRRSPSFRVRLGRCLRPPTAGGGKRHHRGRGGEAGAGTRQPSATGPLTDPFRPTWRRPRWKPGLFSWEVLAVEGECLFTCRKKWGLVGADGRLLGRRGG